MVNRKEKLHHSELFICNIKELAIDNVNIKLQQSFRCMYPDLDLERAVEEADSRSTLSLPYVHRPLSGI